MALAAGVHVGPYEILAPLGAGSMGEVYRARDTILKREVALKALPEAFVRDPDRLARFKREAQLLASLNHPHIAALHGLQSSNGIDYLVMEYVPGTTLADRIASRRLRISDALPLFAQIAAALEAAHDKGIVHRDLKPANINVTPEGRAKVLDFGVATSLVEEPALADLADSPTMTGALTAVGSITGTAAYMSPEQARGEPVDRRTDIWAFGCVCYEALTGKRAFAGATLSEVLAEVTKGEPDWSALGADVPERIRTLLRRCLRKDRERRLQSIGDARIEIEDAIAELNTRTPAAVPRKHDLRRVGLYVAAGALLASLLVLAGLWSVRTPATTPTTRAAIEIPPGSLGFFSSLLLSPDGRTVVFGGGRQPTSHLYVRTMGSTSANPIPGTEGAYHPFLSPDGKWVGFFTPRALKKIAVAGGLAQDIAPIESDAFSTASWGTDDTIVFVQGARPALWRVKASGGTPERLREPDARRHERSYVSPDSIAGGTAILYTTRTDDGFSIALFIPSTGEQRVLIAGARDARYSPTGHIVFWQDYSLRAVPFDTRQLAVTGPAVTVVPDVSGFGGWGAAYSISQTGDLVYYPAFENKIDRALTWVDRQGVASPIAESRQDLYVFPRISPDGQQAIVRFEGPGDCYLNTVDFNRGSWSRLTFLGDSHAGVWSPDGTRVAFESERASGINLVVVPADGGPEQTVYVSANDVSALSWSADGQLLVFDENHLQTGWDINVVPAAGGTARPVLQTNFSEREPVLSPDGKWMAYRSDESGITEVYVRPFPGPGPRHVISVGGGSMPRWAQNGRLLFYRSGDAIMRVAVGTDGGFTAGKPERFLKGDYYLDGGYDVAADGERVLALRSRSTPASSQIQIVFNWAAELKARVAAK